MSKFVTSFTDSLFEVMKPVIYRGAVLYENGDGSWTWKAKEITMDSLLDLQRVVDAVYNIISHSIKIIKN